MTSGYCTIEKSAGETPLQAIERLRSEQSIPPHIPLSYAGRLDPMASGKLLILVGEECKKQKDYTGLDKEYIVEVLCGVSSDTGDILGIPTEGTERNVEKEDIRSAVQKEIGTHTLPYPAFSSKTVSGKPLFLYALEGILDTISIPTHPETFYDIILEDTSYIEKDVLERKIFSLLEAVPRTTEPSKALGEDFRQDDIRAAWKTFFRASAISSFLIFKIKVTAGTGAYMRSLAIRLGETLGTTALALSIHRTKIGTFDESSRSWINEF